MEDCGHAFAEAEGGEDTGSPLWEADSGADLGDFEEGHCGKRVVDGRGLGGKWLLRCRWEGLMDFKV